MPLQLYQFPLEKSQQKFAGNIKTTTRTLTKSYE
jgi:hypothetical protein